MRAQCARCGASFDSKHIAHVLCSDRCAHGRWLDRGRRPADPARVPCSDCHQAFLRINPKRRYCSLTCKNRATARRHKKNARDVLRQREWARQHREDNVRRSREWERAHPDRRRGIAHARRAREKGAAGRFTAEEWKQLVRRYNERCAYCGSAETLTVDHRIPLARGGSNRIDNILPACGWCNRSKGTLDEAGFRRRLAKEQARRAGPASMVARPR